MRSLRVDSRTVRVPLNWPVVVAILVLCQLFSCPSLSFVQKTYAQSGAQFDDRVPNLRKVPQYTLTRFEWCIRKATTERKYRTAALWILDWFATLQKVSKCELKVVRANAEPAMRKSLYHILLRSLPKSNGTALPWFDIQECAGHAFNVATEIDEATHRNGGVVVYSGTNLW